MCFSFAACDDDSGGGDMGMDMGVKMDMAGMDMSGTAVDMSMMAQASAEVVVADVVGTVYQETGDGGVGAPVPLTHRLEVVTSFPSLSVPSDFSDLNNSGLMISGCAANRYDYTPGAGGKVAAPDVNVGTVVVGGWESGRFAFSPAAPAAQGNVFAMPLPTTANCAVSVPSASPIYYGCAFAGAPGTPATAGGTPVDAVAFPALPLTNATNPANSWTGLCAAFGGGTASAACLAACDQNLHSGICEQHLLYPTVGTGDAAVGDTVSIMSPGAAPFNAASHTFATTPFPVSITDITVGGTSLKNASGTPGLDAPPMSLDVLEGHINATTGDIVISYSCDINNNAGTTGAGCGTLSPFELVTLVAQSSNGNKATFGADQLPKYGTMTCLQNANHTGSTITVKAAAITAMLGGQTTGAVSLAMIRLTGALVQAGPNQLFSAGVGQFSLVDVK